MMKIASFVSLLALAPMMAGAQMTCPLMDTDLYFLLDSSVSKDIDPIG